TCHAIYHCHLLHSPFSPLRFVFFLYCSRPLRYLHSFPTRRSSDLLPSTWPGSVARSRVGSVYIEGRIPVSIRFFFAANIRLRSRSEEHTSELQSLRHLVCRLLLEKKKKKKLEKHI